MPALATHLLTRPRALRWDIKRATRAINTEVSVPIPRHNPMTRERIAVFGGTYNNYLALDAALADARRRGVDGLYCLGDMGAFGPHPDRVFPLLIDNHVECIQGNYDNSIGNDLAD